MAVQGQDKTKRVGKAGSATAATAKKPPAKRGRKPKAFEVSGQTIRADEVMTATEFRERLGIGMETYLTMRRRGLMIRRISRNHIFIDGADYIAFIRSLPIEMVRVVNGVNHRETFNVPENVTE